MTDLAASSLPGFGVAFTEQLRVVGLAVRREALVLAGVVVAAGVMIYLDMLDSRVRVDAFPLPGVLMIMFGALAPFAVWKGEPAFGAAHLWTLPVERRRHGLIKVAAGAVWLLVGVASIQLGLLALALVTGGSVGLSETRVLVGPGGWDDLSAVRWSTPAWQWATPFTTALVCYVIGSAFMLGVKYPLRWGTLAVASFFALGMLAESGVTAGLAERLFDEANDGRLGINQATGVGVSEEIDGAPPPPGAGTSVLVLYERLPSLIEWATAALAWAAAGLIALFVAASRHREG